MTNYFPPLIATQAPYLPSYLGTLNILTFAYFSSGLLIGYSLHRICANQFNWERHSKSPVQHFSDCWELLGYAFPVFIFGAGHNLR